jgi:hypothetical protein
MSSSALKSTNDSKQASGNKLQLTTSDEVSFEFKNLKHLKVDFAEATCTDESSIKKTIINWVQTKI